MRAAFWVADDHRSKASEKKARQREIDQSRKQIGESGGIRGEESESRARDVRSVEIRNFLREPLNRID